jgi:hypothetical protein
MLGVQVGGTDSVRCAVAGFVLRVVNLWTLLPGRWLLTLWSAVVTLCTTRLNIHKFYVLPTQCIYVFCVDLRTNSDYFPIQH